MSTHAARTISISPRVDEGMETDLAIVLSDYYTGDLVHGTTGVCSSTITWANAAIVKATDPAAGKWTEHTQSADAVVAIPPLTKGKVFLMRAYDSASPAKTDIPTRKGLYDPASGMTYGDDVPTIGGRVQVALRN